MSVTVLPAVTIDLTLRAGDWPGEDELLALVARAVEAAGAEAGLQWPEGAELSLLFTDDEEMAQINGQWRNKPTATNVLSFPGGDVAPGEAAGPMIGDLVFAHATVCREAEEQGKGVEEHLTHLAVHGFLHLFGYDHQNGEEAEAMEEMERRTLARLGIGDPYAYLEAIAGG